MDSLKASLKHHPVIYVTRDIERALGLPLATEGYFIISNASPFAKETKTQAGAGNVLLIEEAALLDTHELLKHPLVQAFIREKKGSLVVFKNTTLIERICAEAGWTLLNPPAALAAQVEEKITQLEFLPEIRQLFPEYTVTTCGAIEWGGAPFVLQFNHSHTGSGTVLIDSRETLQKLKKQFPNRDARVASYIEGYLFTNNNVVTKTHVLAGNISYQITGLPPFTSRPFATIGNDWGVVETLLTPTQKQAYLAIVDAVGQALLKRGWKGLFGIDVIMEKETGKLFLLEINARQPASTTFESQLQQTVETNGQMTTFAGHLAALLDIDMSEKDITPLQDGAQIILRNNPLSAPSSKLQATSSRLQEQHFHIISYTNTAPESDLLRIQSRRGLMQDHNTFNTIGQIIVDALG